MLSLAGFEVYACQVSMTLTTEARTSNNKIDSFLFHNHIFSQMFLFRLGHKMRALVFMFSCHRRQFGVSFFRQLLKMYLFNSLKLTRNANAEMPHFRTKIR